MAESASSSGRERFELGFDEAGYGDVDWVRMIGQGKLHKRVEVTVHGKTWDVIKLINFLSYMPMEFRTDGVKRTAKPGFDKCMVVWHDTTKVFEILLQEDLSAQKVYLKGWTSWIHFSGGMYYVERIPWSLDKGPEHPLKVFGRFFGRGGRSPNWMVEAAFSSLFSRVKRYHITGRNPISRLRELLKELPGRIELVEQDWTEGIRTECGMVTRLTWVCPWALDRVQCTMFFELDASFKATRPYCYCLANSIINNESLPVAITMV